MLHINNRKFIYFFITFLISISLYPFLISNGYTLTFDMVWGPHYPEVEQSKNYWLLFKLLNFLSDISLSLLTQNIILLSIVILSLIGVQKLTLDTIYIESDYIPKLIGLVYIFNPFFYTRFITGQWLVLVGYTILPWAILSIWKFLNKPDFKSSLPVLTWLAAIGLSSIHTLGIVALISMVMFFVTIKSNQLKQKLIWSMSIISTWVIINLMWLIPLISGTSDTGKSIRSFGTSQLEAFATNGTIFDSPAISALFLTGFWADDQRRYSLSSDFGFPWYIAAGILFTLMIIGLVYVIRKKDKLGISIAISAFIAWILAVGVAWNVTAPITYFLHEYVPLYAGYREPHKWLMLLAIAYAYLGSMGLVSLSELLIRQNLQRFIAPMIYTSLALPILFTPNLAWGAGGQLKSVQYPNGWESAANALNAVPDDTNILVLPWHQYLHVDFADRVVANPTKYYFTQNMIVGDNPELQGVPVENKDNIHRYVNNILLPQRKTVRNAGIELDKLDIAYVMVLKEADYDQYEWVKYQKGLTIYVDNESMTVYRVNELTSTKDTR